MTTSTGSNISVYDEIVIHVPAMPSGAQPHAARCDEERVSVYDCWIYAKGTLPIRLGAPGEFDPSRKPPQDIGGLPLVGYEQLEVEWKKYPDYEEYLQAYAKGDGSLLALQALLAESSSDGIKQLTQLTAEGKRPLRMWWANEAAELDDLPWETATLGSARPPRLSRVRGRPRATTPPLPLWPEQPLRIAVFDPAGHAQVGLREALEGLGPGVQVVWLGEKEPRSALLRAASAGFEVLQMVADGSVPFGVEGLLDFPGGTTLSSAEITSLLSGSRVMVLSLSTSAKPLRPSGGVVTRYRAFAQVAREIEDGPSIVIPLGPAPQPVVADFWSKLYRRFADSLDVEDAFIAATPCPFRVPGALYLKHRFGRQFVRLKDLPEIHLDPWPDGAAPSTDPAKASAELAVSGKLLDAVEALERKYPALGGVLGHNGLLAEERERQRKLEAYLMALLEREKDR